VEDMKMTRYQKNFKKTVWGFFEVDATSPEDAESKWADGDYDEVDNESDYDFTESNGEKSEWVPNAD
jgi:hypothetical protein